MSTTTGAVIGCNTGHTIENRSYIASTHIVIAYGLVTANEAMLFCAVALISQTVPIHKKHDSLLLLGLRLWHVARVCGGFKSCRSPSLSVFVVRFHSSVGRAPTPGDGIRAGGDPVPLGQREFPGLRAYRQWQGLSYGGVCVCVCVCVCVFVCVCLCARARVCLC